MAQRWWLTVLLLVACGESKLPSDDNPGNPDNPCIHCVGEAQPTLEDTMWFHHGNFIEWHFVAMSGETFDDIRAALPEIYARGVRALMIYPPYHGNPDGYYGAEPISIFETHPSAGSMEEFRALVREAHDHGIAVLSWMVLHTAGPQTTEWQQALAHRSEGRDTAATRAFLWSDVDPMTDHGALMGGWAQLPGTDSYYATAWDYPAWNYENIEARNMASQILEYWLHAGVDGFGFDAPNSHVNHSRDDIRELLGELPRSHGANYQWAEGLDWIDEQDFQTQYADPYNVSFGYFGVDDDETSVAEWISEPDPGDDDPATADYLEHLLVSCRDQAVALGGGAIRHLVYHEDEDRHAFGAALYAGIGVHVDIFHSAEGDPEDWASWSPSRQEKIAAIANAINGHPAQVPGADRVRVSTGDDPQHYAVLRTSSDGSRRALNIYNFKPTPSTVRVSLAGADIAAQTPTDLVRAEPAAAMDGDTYEVELPGFGYALLDVQ